MEKDYERDLLYIVLFDELLTQDLKSILGEKDKFQSQLFPKVKVPIEISMMLSKKQRKLLKYERLPIHLLTII